MEIVQTDYLIIGAGIVGLTFALNLKSFFPRDKIVIIDKEADIGFHASGRNSGVLHAGFYYHPDSLKAKFTRDGNLELKNYCEKKGLKINNCGKVVVAKNEEELEILYELKKRGYINGVEIYVITEKELSEIEPMAKTYKYALWSPNTSVVDPLEILSSFKKDLTNLEVEFYFNTPYIKRVGTHIIKAGKYFFEYKYLINCAGLYADKVAKDFGLGENYVLIPFKGVYLEHSEKDPFIKTNIYPVPNLKTPFLGVHFTIKVDGIIKIGPTAMLCFWRENYKGMERFNFKEFIEVLGNFIPLAIKNKLVREVAFTELKKWYKEYLKKEASKMVKYFPMDKFNRWGKSGIRAQLIDRRTFEFVNDFVIEENEESIHILNAVSPGFTASLPFTRYVIEKYLLKKWR